MIGIYFSGTGNTKYCIEKFISICESNINAIALENKTVLDEIKKECLSIAVVSECQIVITKLL